MSIKIYELPSAEMDFHTRISARIKKMRKPLKIAILAFEKTIAESQGLLG